MYPLHNSEFEKRDMMIYLKFCNQYIDSAGDFVERDSQAVEPLHEKHTAEFELYIITEYEYCAASLL